ncbi:MAG: CHAP domain-containing protein [Candidatus Saccharimonas sp.]
MKHRSTTPVSKGIVTKSALVAAAVIFAVSGPISVSFNSSTVYATSYEEYQRQIDALNAEVGQYQQQANQLNEKAKTLENELALLTSQKAAIQAQIDVSQKKYDQLKEKIAETEKEIQNNKDALGDTIADMYVDNSISPLEMLASSNDIGDFVDKQEYRNSIQSSLSGTITQINTLKKQLEKQQVEVKRVLADQENQRKALADKEAEKQNLVNKTRGDENSYRELSASRDAEKSRLVQKQQDLLSNRYANGGGSLSGGGSLNSYEAWIGGPCYMDANWNSNRYDPLGYACGQCTSYAAYMVKAKTGVDASYWGNANQWPGSSSAYFSRGSTPRSNSIGVILAPYGDGRYGHVVYVKNYNPATNTVDISQYNEQINGQWGLYSERYNVPASVYDTYIYL